MGPSQAGTEEVLAPGMVEGTNKVALWGMFVLKHGYLNSIGMSYGYCYY